ncbi:MULTISPECIES: outer membrane protein [Azorhizobium]|uniref:Putative outer-membrane immunogenic protein n=1 Tax=Azorhizobium caulinodans (strain ATCC 43989 / DSM 5975 / JCM 20966 / LMG 6465 / NBRC 14845 / NCIMB 13405 / ORS 571) TaxID=438753 RepID=A8IKX9_AZOC5|nr:MULTISPECIES: outer membrane protein [Azorhizobium]TDU00743.1 outer membrane immunogenic protein [Azorhizobium sp. AG788]BAF89961.1 putative outer-membrane immunogenic protein [Azorhizobium caulinodans ORS 571]
MKTRIIAALAATLAASPVAAADLSYGNSYGYAPAAAAPASWTGFYVGGNIGYGWGSAGADSPKGFLGGLQAGYNLQMAGSPIVLGLETDFDWAGMNDGNYSQDYIGTVRARAGFAFDRVLIYGTAGFAYGKGSYQVFGLSNSQTSYGWALGAGAEYAIDRNWSARAEYMYVDLGNSTYGTWVGPTNVSYDTSVLRAGVNYRF